MGRIKHDYSERATEKEYQPQTLIEQIADAIIISSVCLMITAIVMAGL